MFDSTGGKGLEPTRAARLSNCRSQLRHQERGRNCKDFVAKEYFELFDLKAKS